MLWNLLLTLWFLYFTLFEEKRKVTVAKLWFENRCSGESLAVNWVILASKNSGINARVIYRFYKKVLKHNWLSINITLILWKLCCLSHLEYGRADEGKKKTDQRRENTGRPDQQREDLKWLFKREKQRSKIKKADFLFYWQISVVKTLSIQ